MNVKQVIENLNLEIICGKELIDIETKGVYINDLLSFVMSHGEKNNIWITVQIHPNIIAVAVLLEFSCIIVPENIKVEKETIKKAQEEGVILLQSSESSYELAYKLKQLGV